MSSSISDTIRFRGVEHLNRFYSTYYGIVRDIRDSLHLNRILVTVPEVFSADFTMWALPFNQFSGNGYGMQIMPQMGDTVVISFRFGDPRFPLWVHSNFHKDEKPPEFEELDTYGFITPKGVKVLIRDKDGSVEIITKSGNRVFMEDKDKISITNTSNLNLVLDKNELKMGKDSLKHFTIGEEIKSLLTDLHTHITAWSTLLVSPTQIPPIGTSTGDPSLVKWLGSLSKILSKFT